MTRWHSSGHPPFPSFRHSVAICAVLLAGGSCSASEDVERGGASTNHGDRGGGNVQDGDDALFGTTSCSEVSDCSGGEYCSAAQVCVAEGRCADSLDCSSGEYCGRSSGLCLAEGACAQEGDCPEGFVCENKRCEISTDANCGGGEFTADPAVPNVMLVLDRSGSMDGTVAARGDTKRWDAAKDATRQFLSDFEERASFGLATYPRCKLDDNGKGICLPGEVVVPVSAQSPSQIRAFLDSALARTSDTGSEQVATSGQVKYLCAHGVPATTTGPTLLELGDEASIQDPTQPNIIIILTDGSEVGSCVNDSNRGPVAAAALASQDIPIRTYVVGVRGSNRDELNAIAEAGGTGEYYFAESTAELAESFKTILVNTLGCELKVESAPEDEIFVYLNDKPYTPLEEDPSHGFSYNSDTKTISLHGSACERVKSGAATEVDAVFGCPRPIPH